jgi:2-polyprenyl-3-methyl-5-hydroxy-6-metoxy-1,4-benzoquinol methylase
MRYNELDLDIQMETHYRYPDFNDKLTMALIREKEPFQGYWENSEKRILGIVKEIIEKHELNPKNSWLLDAGCGTGRLLPEFQRYFSSILAIDPDYSQIEKAKKVARERGFADKVLFNITSVDQLNWEKESFDVILCSHVIQHVHTKTIPKILHGFHELLKPDGLMFLMTTHSRRSYGYYIKSFLKDSKLVEQRIRKTKFNSLIKNECNILPIHFFSTKNLANLLKKAGFVLHSFRTYHVIRKSKIFSQEEDRDILVNNSNYLKSKFGRDIMLVCQKQTSF